MPDVSVDVTYLFSGSGLVLNEASTGLTATAKDGGKVQIKGETIVVHEPIDRDDAFDRAVHELYNTHPDFRMPVRAQVIGVKVTGEDEE